MANVSIRAYEKMRSPELMAPRPIYTIGNLAESLPSTAWGFTNPTAMPMSTQGIIPYGECEYCGEDYN